MTLKITDWLKSNNHNYALLEEQIGIKAKSHEDGRVILNYSQIDSPKKEEKVRECRGLVLDSSTGELIARGFRRFFNWGECPEEMEKFNWADCYCNTKEDGSFILVYFWNESWHINSRASFGDAEVNDSGYTWRELFLETGVNPEELNPAYSYVFELCSPYNQVVRQYYRPLAFLLAVFEGEDELSQDYVDFIAEQTGLTRPNVHNFSSIHEVEKFIRHQAQNDKTFEGLVVCDCHGTRFKVKSESYLALSRLNNNGNIVSPKNIIPLILQGETDEVLAYFPHTKDAIEEWKTKIDVLKTEVDNLWFCFHDVNRKKFAEQVKNHPFAWALFSAYGTDLNPLELINSNPDKVVRCLT